MRFLHEPFQGKGHFAFRLLLPSRATIKAFVLRALRPDLTEINGPFHLPFYTRHHFAKVINGAGRSGIIWELNAKKAKCFGSFPPLMAGHKNNGRTDNSHAICPYIHITEISGNPHVYLHTHSNRQICLLRCKIETGNWQKKHSNVLL